MKPILKNIAFVALIAIAVLVSCTKGSNSGGGILDQQIHSNSSNGTEIIFNGVIRYGNVFVDDTTNYVYAATPDRPDLFYNPDKPISVSIRVDNCPDWIDVPSISTFQSINNGFVYDIYRSVLYVFAIPATPLLIGSNVSVKVVFP